MWFSRQRGEPRALMPRLIACAALLLIGCVPVVAAEAAPKRQPESAVCDPSADYFLGTEDYHSAIRSHLAVLTHDPNNALAHYHLGFAYGMVGQTGDEIREYQQAVALGLRVFDLFLNLGLARFESGDLIGATEALITSSALTSGPEPRFDLGLVYERRGMLREAESELLEALAIAPDRSEYLNMLAVIAAERGEIVRARSIWTSILSRDPQDESAAANLRLLETAYLATPKSVALRGAPAAEAALR